MEFSYSAADLGGGAVGALPKTMYLAGQGFARIEQPADTSSGSKNLIVVHDPDIWVIDGRRKNGTHSINPDVGIRNPILGPSGPQDLFEFEYGQEAEFFDRVPTRNLPSEKVGTVYCRARELTYGDFVVRLHTDEVTQLPVQVQVLEGKKLLFTIRYLTYQKGLPFDPSLFEPPKDVVITESKQ